MYHTKKTACCQAVTRSFLYAGTPSGSNQQV
jgi:hypothetical protein